MIHFLLVTFYLRSSGMVAGRGELPMMGPHLFLWLWISVIDPNPHNIPPIGSSANKTTTATGLHLLQLWQWVTKIGAYFARESMQWKINYVRLFPPMGPISAFLTCFMFVLFRWFLNGISHRARFVFNLAPGTSTKPYPQTCVPAHFTEVSRILKASTTAPKSFCS